MHFLLISENEFFMKEKVIDRTHFLELPNCVSLIISWYFDTKYCMFSRNSRDICPSACFIISSLSMTNQWCYALVLDTMMSAQIAVDMSSRRSWTTLGSYLLKWWYIHSCHTRYRVSPDPHRPLVNPSRCWMVLKKKLLAQLLAPN